MNLISMKDLGIRDSLMNRTFNAKSSHNILSDICVKENQDQIHVN